MRFEARTFKQADGDLRLGLLIVKRSRSFGFYVNLLRWVFTVGWFWGFEK